MAVAIPDAYDYGSTVPRVQTAVTGYRVADALVVSDAPGKALVQAGRDLQEVAADTEKWSLSLDSTMAQDALNKLRAKRSDLTVGEDGFLKVRGGDVLNKKGPDGQTIYDSYPQRLQTQYEELTANSNLSPRAKRMLANAASNEILGFKADLSRHGLSESEKYQAAVFVDTKSTLTDRAIQNVNEAKAFEQGLADVQQAVRTRAAQLGVPSEAMEKAAVSDVVKFGIMQKIATGDSSAIGFYEKYKDRLDPKDSLAIESSIKTMRNGVEARDWVSANSGPSSEVAKAGVKTSMQHWTAAGYSAPVAAGITAGFLRESQFNGGAVNPRDGRDGSDSISIGQWNSARATAFKSFAAQNGLDPRDVKTGLAYAKAEIDGTIPYSVSGLSPDFKARLQAAKTEKEAADIMTRGYFRPLHTEGESALRQRSAAAILAQYTPAADPLAAAVNGPAKLPEGSSDGIVDARRMMLDVENRKIALAQKAQEDFGDNLPLLQTTLHQIEAQYQQQKAGVQFYKDNLYANVQDWMSKSGPNGGPAVAVPPANIFSQLTWEQQQSIERQVERNIAGKKTVTNQQAWYAIQQGLSSNDPAVRDMWASAPLFQYKEHLSDQDFQELAKMQAAARKGDPEKELSHVRGVNELVNDTLNKLDIDPTPKPGSKDATKAADFRRIIQDQLTAFEKQKGHKATPEEVQKIIDQQVRVVVEGGWFSKDKRRYQMTVDDVPKADQTKIRDALTRSGQPVTDQAVIDLYVRKLGQPAAQPAPVPVRGPATRPSISLAPPAGRSRSGELPPYESLPGMSE